MHKPLHDHSHCALCYPWTSYFVLIDILMFSTFINFKITDFEMLRANMSPPCLCMDPCVRVNALFFVRVCVFVSAWTCDSVCFSRWLSGTPWGIKQDFPSLGVLGRMVGWWLQSFLKLSTLSLTWDLTWDLTSAWQICPDQWETSECLTMVSIERFLFCFTFLPPPSLAPSVLALFSLSLSGETGKVGDGVFVLSLTKTCVVALCLDFT